MDSLQQQFGGEPEITTKKNQWFPVTLLAILGLVGFVVAGFWLWPQPEPIPMAEEVVESPLSDSEVETYRASLKVSSAVEDSTLVVTKPNLSTKVEEVADSAVPANQNEPTPFIPSVTATPVIVAPSTAVGEVSVTMEKPVETIYVEGDTEIADVTITQPEAAALTSIELTGVVVTIDTSLGQLLMAAGGEVYTLVAANGRFQTNDGKLLTLASLKTNDILAVKGQRLGDSPVIQNEVSSFIGVQKLVEEAVNE